MKKLIFIGMLLSMIILGDNSIVAQEFNQFNQQQLNQFGQPLQPGRNSSFAPKSEPGFTGNYTTSCCDLHSAKTLFQWSGSFSNNGMMDDSFDEPLVTDRPDFTESSSTVGLNRIQLEAGYTFLRDDEGPFTFRSHTLPEALLRIGMLAEWFELRIGWTYAFEKLSFGPFSIEDDGASDILLGMKIALTEQCGCLPETAIIFQSLLPTGSDGFSVDEFTLGVNLLYSWEITDLLSIGGSTSFNRLPDASGHFFLEMAQSLTAAYTLTEQLGAYTEYFVIFPHSARSRDALPRHFFNGGFTYLITNDFQVDWRAGAGLNNRAADFFTGVGFAYRW